jgi:hypothetical protein
MRIGSNTLTQNKPLSRNNISKGIIPSQSKNFNNSLSDTFNVLNAWSPLRGTWTTDGNTATTSTAASSYPILTSYDLKSQNITATMSLNAAGAGVVFWLQDENNWWAGVTYYIQSSEPYNTGTYSCNCRSTGTYFGCSGGSGCTVAQGCPEPPCGRWGEEVCSTCYYTASRARYNFFIRLLNSVNGVVTDLTNINLRSLCGVSTQWSPCTAGSTDNINGIQISTSENIVTVRARDDANNFYGSAISYTASNPVRGYESGIIFTPGSNYLSDSSALDITIVGE